LHEITSSLKLQYGNTYECWDELDTGMIAGNKIVMIKLQTLRVTYRETTSIST